MTSNAALAVFALYCCVILGGALAAVFCANMVRAFVGLIFSLAGVAGLYLLMQAPFLAFMQLLIYIGAVCALIFFALMLLKPGQDGDESGKTAPGRSAEAFAAGALVLLLLLPPLFLGHVPEHGPENIPLAQLGQKLLDDYVLPFELISIILLAAMSGAVLLVWNRRPGA